METYETKVKNLPVRISVKDILIAAKKDYQIYPGTEYFAEVEDRYIPAKKLVEEILSCKSPVYRPHHINTFHALKILRKMGIPVLRKKDILRKLAGSVSIGGDAVEEEKKLYSD